MADETPDLRIDAVAKLVQAGIAPSEKASTAPDAPRSPMTALTDDMVACATKATNNELDSFGGRKAFSPETVSLRDQQNLQACIDNFAMNVRLASSEATNTLPNNTDKDGRGRK